MGVITHLGMEFNQVEGLSIFQHKDKDIVYIDYSTFDGDKAKSLQLIKAATELYTGVYAKYKSRVVLGITNVENLHYDTELLTAFKETQAISERAYKKVAIIGVTGIRKIAYTYVVNISSTSMKTFNTFDEAKEWVVSEELPTIITTFPPAQTH